MAVEEDQLRELPQVIRRFALRSLRFGIEDPPDMGVPESLLARGVDVSGTVGVSVVVAVMLCPPDDALLRTRLGTPGQNELENPAGLEGLVAEVPVVARGHREHVDAVERDAADSRFPGDAGDQCTSECDEVNPDEASELGGVRSAFHSPLL